MTLRQALPALTFALAATFASQPLLAQGHGGGSHGGGGGSHGGGGGNAVPRGSGGGGGSHPGYGGGGAQYRHPQAGTGYYNGYGHSHGYYGYGHYHGYYPYYGYGYGYPYYSYPYYWPGVSLSFGWGYPSTETHYVYGTPAYSVGAPAPYGTGGEEDPGAAPPPPRETERPYAAHSALGPSGRVRLEVRPEDTSVYLDDAFHGTARDARSLSLPPGHHQIELVRPGFATERREVTVVTGESQDVFVELLRP
jgi:hypothetical protein